MITYVIEKCGENKINILIMISVFKYELQKE